jgi:hypothetical protein
MIRNTETVELVFALAPEEGWPPVATECLPCMRSGDGFRILVAPLFVKGVSVGDVIVPIGWLSHFPACATMRRRHVEPPDMRMNPAAVSSRGIILASSRHGLRGACQTKRT